MNTTEGFNLQPGTVIAGRFEVIKSLGSGSMGLVYACRDRELSGRIVAVKVLYPEVAQDEVSMARFRNEIVSSYRVSHPNVIRSYELVRDNDLIAYTMEYVDGGILLDYINSKNPTSIERAIQIIIEMCAGVQAIHVAGIVHRDLKPENILITQEGEVKIADFGIARMNRGPKLTEHGGVVGTIDYVSPEYILESKVDWRSDIYALGVLSYELIVGVAPFDGDTIYDVMTKRLNEDPKVPSSLRPECPPELDKVILKALARDLNERYQSAAEMGSDLTKIYSTFHAEPLKSKGVDVLTASSEFQGPKLDTETLESLHQPVSGRSIVDSGSASDLFTNDGTNQFDNNEPMINFTPGPMTSNPTDPNTKETVTLNPEIVDIASYYQAGVGQMESVLSGSEEAPLMREDAFLHTTTSLKQMQSAVTANKSFAEKIGFDYRRVLFVIFVLLAIGIGIICGLLLVELMFGEMEFSSLFSRDMWQN